MTVTYTAEVATSSLGCFLRLLIRWKGSIYKLLWKDFLIFLIAYYLLNFIYRFALNDDQRVIFESVSQYCNSFNNLIPVAFVLGFYISIVVTRWWEQFNHVPWPDKSAMFVTALIHGHDERGRLMRRTIMRYMCLSFTLTLSSISTAVKKRFPTLDHITESGIMLPNEQVILEDIKTPHSKYFIPLVWATSLISRARKEGRIKDDFAVKTLIDEINNFRGSLGTLYNYDWISVPLVYTQVVTLAVYTFFLSCLMGRQFLQPKDRPQFSNQDFYVPVFTLLQFLFYMGWLKVAETLINPFGEDDDDFEVNWVIDRNLQVSYLIVDEMHADFPELIRDCYWDEIDFKLPYTEASKPYMSSPHLGSAFDINVDPRLTELIPLESIQEHTMKYGDDTEEGIDITDNGLSRTKRLLSNASTNSSRLNLPRGLPNIFKRSSSRTSRSKDKLSNAGSHTSVATSANPPSPGPEDIFQMTDLSGDEDDRMSVLRSASFVNGSPRPNRKKAQSPKKSPNSPDTPPSFPTSKSRDFPPASEPPSLTPLPELTVLPPSSVVELPTTNTLTQAA